MNFSISFIAACHKMYMFEMMQKIISHRKLYGTNLVAYVQKPYFFHFVFLLISEFCKKMYKSYTVENLFRYLYLFSCNLRIVCWLSAFCKTSKFPFVFAVSTLIKFTKYTKFVCGAAT